MPEIQKNQISELITIENRNGKESVNARELHEFLGNKRQFSDWIKQRVEQYGFIEGTDYTLISQICETSSGGTVRKEYYISLDMAKELSMVENNEKGRQARQYFIECEKKLKNLTLEQMTLLVIEGQKKRLAELEQSVQELKPKAEFADSVSDSSGSITFTDFARAVGYGRNRLFEFCRENKLIDKNNNPYQEYIDSGYFKSIERIKTVGGKSLPYFITMITGKGQVWLEKKIRGGK